MNIIRVKEILRETTVVLSKGEVTKHQLEAMGVPKLLWDALPTTDEVEGEDLRIVDCQVLSVGVDLNRAARWLNAFTSLIDEYPEKDKLKEGISYKTLVPILGDEIAALQFFALGHVMGLWSVLLPEDLGVFDPGQRDVAALFGWVYITGYPSVAFSDAVVC